MYNRLLANRIANASKSVLLLGPRQVGKSTLLNSLKPDLTVNLASEAEYFTFQAHLSELEDRIQADRPKTVFIDEIQRIPRLLNSIQVVIDREPGIKFFLSGSSARKLKRGKANLLPGRLFTYELGPMCRSEISEKEWSEEQALRFGMLPGVIGLKSDAERKKLLRSYTSTYLKEEIIAESLVRGLDGFTRFLREAVVNSGGYLDYTKLAKRAKISRQAVTRHFEILEDTLLASRVYNDPDLDPERVDLIKHPRYFLFDLGVVNALRGSFDLSEDRIGSLWEYSVYNQIRNSAGAFDVESEIFNFRTRGGFEVDFIARVDGVKFAIECKSNRERVEDRAIQNLKAMERYYPKIQKLIIYRGKTERKIEGVWAVPLVKALEIMGLL